MIPCLTVIARYPAEAPRLDWDVFYPETTTLVHSVLHDSAKRAPETTLHLVIQAHPGFSRERLEGRPEEWSRDLLWEAGEFLGAWVEAPEAVERHAWAYARVVRTAELARPTSLRLPNGAVLGLCGDAFSPAGGAEGAWLSGSELAPKLDACLDS
jgi:predicted NAD/FAD-dependent oxidoreductase